MRFALVACVLAGLGVAAGAFGAHGLRDRIDAGSMSAFETAVRYQLVHSLALLVSSQRSPQPPAARWAGFAFAFGILLFSGSLYALALGAPRGLGMITPFGGLAFIAGWIALAASYRGAA
jgi:uncharacterized membrane protein YgdD (TMEM256/DUF423 family)